MPTKKPIVQAVLEQEIYEKLERIAHDEKRSKSQITSIAVEKYIEEYEKENGHINVNNLSISKIG